MKHVSNIRVATFEARIKIGLSDMVGEVVL